MAELLEQFECGVCDTLHDTFYRAQECCEPEIREVLVCPICDDVFDGDHSGRREAKEHLQEHSAKDTAEEKYLELLRSGPVPFELREKILNDNRTPERKLIDSVIFQETI